MSFISEQELVDFHVNHFGTVPQGVSIVLPCEPSPELYPDGTTRTITDEEIAFFRASELREKQQQTNKQFNNAVVESRKSIAETQPFTPIANDSASYGELFGQQAQYIQMLDDACDTGFIGICRVHRVRNYYPVLPIY
jgi:hypothetical protein